MSRPRILLVLAVLAALPGSGRGAEGDEDFEPIEATRSIALGPNPGGSAVVWADIGYLRSGIGVSIGLGATLDIVLGGDAFLLQRGFSGQDTVYVGLRASPFNEGPFRASIQLTAGEIFVPNHGALDNMGMIRGDLRAGGSFGPVLAYGFVAIRGISSDAPADPEWSRDEEFGVGAEFVYRHLIVGGEIFSWARPDHAGLFQWRVRAGYAF